MILPPLTNWNNFFVSRHRMRWMQRVFGGVPLSWAFLAAESAGMITPVFNPTAPILGMDPMFVIGAATLFGVSLVYVTGGSAFRLCHHFLWPTWNKRFREMGDDFSRRVIKYRANVPPNPTQIFGADFYGEWIGSVTAYRRWIRQQKALKAAREFKL